MRGYTMSLFVLVCSFLVFFNVHSATGLNGLEQIDADLWGLVNKACSTVAELEPSAGFQDTLYLRIVEYTTFGSHGYSMYPDAARALVQSSSFDPKKRTVIFIHGFTDNPLLVSGEAFATAYKIHGGYNILALDASKLIHALYARSSVMVKYAGEALGIFLHSLVKHGVNVEDVHLVGHSLGAHIGGFAGKAFQSLNPDMKLPRITGMDPAGPCFTHKGPQERLDKNDADFVDIIHTNIGVYGINETIGHVDFFPNGGGLRQPGCVESVCSHNRAWMIYDETVNLKNNMIGVRCGSVESFNNGECNHNDKAVMGYATPDTTRGIFYLKTGAIPIFGKGLSGASS